MSALDKLFALFQALTKVSGREYIHLQIYNDQSCSVLAPDGTTLAEFDSFAEGVDKLVELIIEAAK